MDGIVTLGELNFRKCNTFFTDTVFSITYFSHKLQEQSTCTQNSIHDNVEIMKNYQFGFPCHRHKVK